MRYALVMILLSISTVPVHAQTDDPKQLTLQEIADLPEDQAEAKVAELQEAEAKDRQDALADFKRGAGLAISIVMGQEESIDEAAVVDEKVVVTRRSKDNVRAALEVHQLLTANIFTSSGRAHLRKQIEDCGDDPVDCPLFGIGPFAAIQVADDNAISSAGLGVMVGVRSDPRAESSFNLGLGLVWDNRVKTLADGFVEGQPLPTGETAVRFTEKSSRRLMLTLSFAF